MAIISCMKSDTLEMNPSLRIRVDPTRSKVAPLMARLSASQLSVLQLICSDKVSIMQLVIACCLNDLPMI